MTQYNSLNVKLSNSQLNKLKPAKKNETEVIYRLSSDIIANSDDETNFAHKLLLTNRQAENFRKAFANYLSVDIKLWKSQVPKIVQSGGFLGRLLGPLLKTDWPLIKYVLKPLAKSIVIPLGLTAAASAVDVGIHKTSLRSGTAILIIWKLRQLRRKILMGSSKIEIIFFFSVTSLFYNKSCTTC